MTAEKTIRIGGATGFWGDTALGAQQLIQDGAVDYLVFDYLAEITMSIMARARAKKPEAGYALDFVSGVLRTILPDAAQRGIKIISNAGGVNCLSCGQAIEALIQELGLDLKVAVVTGDDILDQADRLRAAGIREMFNGTDMPEKLMSMNAYLGAPAIAAALAQGADIVVTGRCVDSAVTLGACIYEFDWPLDSYDALAGGSLAGHILECGAQATGGIHTDWHLSRDWDNIGFPIAEVAADGSFVVSKPDGTGGLVSFGTVAEQMLYEIGDPRAYFLPDVTCDFSQVTIDELDRDLVRVANAKGRPPTPTYKVSATYEDGFRVGIYHTIGGIDAAAKAERTGEAILKRCRQMLRDSNQPDFSETSIEILGAEGSYGPHSRARGAREVILKLAAKHETTQALNMLVRESTSAATAMSPGICGMAGNRPKVSPVVRLFSCLVPKAELPVAVHVEGNILPVDVPLEGGFDAAMLRESSEQAEAADVGGDDASGMVTVPLVALAYGRSGDKGNHANVGIIARRPDYLPWIRRTLTEQAVASHYAHILEGAVHRFDLPGVHGLNFLLENVLGGGGTASLRNDPQGKAFAQMLLDYPVSVPRALAVADKLEVLAA
ncbi:MAG TPA: terpene utilization protein AtuA [Alphaproteobacteria bacterium]|nr:terpene utilization protein AtuA [Alphaproteobacteria bacterium]HBA43372.1 terpene utilization protein AtuA [Alphaproteobacteria bacterium]HBF99876.1 terpene utilization protein AtuA [Alphaproteobacteria bacterium]